MRNWEHENSYGVQTAPGHRTKPRIASIRSC